MNVRAATHETTSYITNTQTDIYVYAWKDTICYHEKSSDSLRTNTPEIPHRYNRGLVPEVGRNIAALPFPLVVCTCISGEALPVFSPAEVTGERGGVAFGRFTMNDEGGGESLGRVTLKLDGGGTEDSGISS